MDIDKMGTDKMGTDNMDTDNSDTDGFAPPRPRWYAGAIVGTATVLVALVLTEVLVDNAPDTLLGIFTGFLGTLLLGVILVTETGRRDAARRRDAQALDDLEPLRSAAAADRAVER